MSTTTVENADPTMVRLDDQIGWYDRRAASNRRWYSGLKVAEFVAAAAIPIVAGIARSLWGAAILGAVVVVMEGVQQLGQFHANWIGYRSTCEALKHEKFLYLGNAGPYADTQTAHATLATRIEEHISKEHALWVDVQSRGKERT